MSDQLICFDDFELDSGAFELRRAGRAVRLERIPLELLFFLAERRGQLVTREEILKRIWGNDVFVDADNSINTAVRKVRMALKDDPDKPRFVYTVAGKGYRFVVELPEPEVGGVGATTPVGSAAPLSSVPTAHPVTPPAGSVELRAEEMSVGSVAAPKAPVVVPLRRRWALWLALGILGIAGLSFAIPRLLRPAKGVAAPHVKLVVLPFVNLSNDPQQEYFADGITEEVITRLGSLDPQRLGVIARTSSMQYKTAHKGAAQIARELGVNYLLEGSVRRDGERVRITAQLIQASDQMHIWAANFDRNQSDVLRLESDLALAISGKIALALAPEVRARLAEAPPVNPEAYQAYLTALQAWDSRTKSAALRSIAEHQRAIALEPDYAPPYAALASVYSLASVVGAMSTQEAMPKAKEAALRAIALDDSLAQGHTVLAFVMSHYDHDMVGAEREFRRGIELNPNDPAAHFFFSNSFLSPMGRHDEAIAEMKRALELDPFSPPMQSFFGQSLLWARRYNDALAQYKKCADLFPGLAINRERMAHLYTYLGRFEEAIAEDTQAKLLSGESPETAMQQAHALRESWNAEGPSGYWKKLLEFSQLPENPPETYRQLHQIAIIYVRLGEKEKALSSLEKAYDEHEMGLTELAIEPAFDSLHSDPRFRELVSHVGLPVPNR